MLQLFNTLALVVPSVGAILMGFLLSPTANVEAEKRRKVAWIILFAIVSSVVIYVQQRLSERDSQPIADFVFDRTPLFIVPPKDRPEEDNWAIRIRVETNRVLKNACVYLKEARFDDNIYDPIDLTGRIGWYLGAPSWECHDIDTSGYVMLFFVHNKELELFVRDIDGHTPVPALLERLRHLGPGSYTMRFLLQADNLQNGVSKVYRITWRGDINSRDGFEMKSIDN